MITAARSRAVLFFAIAALSFAPFLVHAQAAQQDQLRTAIWSQLVNDPRTANMPPAQLQALVDALTVQARAQNMTAAQITWRPTMTQASSPALATAEAPCDPGFYGYACQVNRAFGFSGGNYEVPIFLLVTSGILLAVIWELMLYHRKKMLQTAAATPPWENMPQ